MGHFRIVWALSLVTAALAFASACSDQAEGERCDLNNNDADCESGLVCTQLDAPRNAAICCPPENGNPPTVAACRRGPTLLDGGLDTTDAGGGAGGSSPSSGGSASGGADASPEAAP